jgi:hypothetical protein
MPEAVSGPDFRCRAHFCADKSLMRGYLSPGNEAKLTPVPERNFVDIYGFCR